MMQTKTNLTAQLQASEPKVRAIYVSTYIPRECGIATFTKDLTNAINILNPHYLADIVAILGRSNIKLIRKIYKVGLTRLTILINPAPK